MASENTIFEIIIGTYERYLLGYNVEMNDDQFTIKPSFSAEAHLQSVKCISSSSAFLASGSLDETIQLFNMKTRQEVGALLHHNGTVTCLGFHDSFMFSCSEDHTVCIWSSANWQCLKTLRGHKKPVNGIAIHPSGKMALTISKDKTIRTWNLINGRSAYSYKIDKVAEKIMFYPDGSHFIVIFDSVIDIYSVKTARIEYSIDFKQKICDVTFINNEILAIGGEGEFILFYDKSGEKCFEVKAHKSRTKALESVIVNEETFLVSASSDGVLKIWHVEFSEDYKIKAHKIGKVNTGSRPTCMTVMLQDDV